MTFKIKAQEFHWNVINISDWLDDYGIIFLKGILNTFILVYAQILVNGGNFNIFDIEGHSNM